MKKVSRLQLKACKITQHANKLRSKGLLITNALCGSTTLHLQVVHINPITTAANYRWRFIHNFKDFYNFLVFLSRQNHPRFILATSADPGEMMHFTGLIWVYTSSKVSFSHLGSIDSKYTQNEFNSNFAFFFNVCQKRVLCKTWNGMDWNGIHEIPSISNSFHSIFYIMPWKMSVAGKEMGAKKKSVINILK